MTATGKFSIHQYQPPGPVATKFLFSRGPIDIIMGPAGSGKTVTSAYKGPLIAANWFPICRDGVIRVKQATIRDTYRDLARTCLASWLDIFPADSPFTKSYEGGQDRPVKHVLQWETIRTGIGRIPVEFTMEFGAIGDHNIEQFIKGYEVSLGWGNECDLLDERVLPLLLQRTGRYPKVSDIAEAELQRLKIESGADEIRLPRLVWGDMNPPDIGHWSYRFCVKEKRNGFNLFKQPSGLSAQAENRAGKPRSSYVMEAETMDEYDVRRYVHGEFGYARDGKPVYPEFRHDFHVADAPLKPVQGIPLSLGIDAGGSPAAVIDQFLPNGQNLTVAEVVSQPGTGPSRFAEMVLEVLLSRFRGFAIAEAYADPSSFYGADRVAGELAWIETVARALNISIMPAPSNEPALRHEAVRWYLGAPIDGNTPRMLIGSDCEVLIGGFAAHYKLTKQASAGATDRLIVAKNEYSHVHDALQYVALGHRGRAGVIGDVSKLGRPGNVVPIRSVKARSDFSVWDV